MFSDMGAKARACGRRRERPTAADPAQSSWKVMAHGEVLFEFNRDELVGDLNRTGSWSFPLVFSI